MHTGEGQIKFNTFCARKCGIMKIKPHYLNVFLEGERRRNIRRNKEERFRQ